MANRLPKILHLNTELTWRGGEQQVLYLMSGLKQRGYQCHLICQPGGGLYPRALEAGVTALPVSMRGELDFIAAWKIARKIGQEEYDIVHSHTSHAHSLAMWASLLVKKRPIRIVTRRIDFSIFRHNFLGMNIYKYRKGVDHVIAISQKIRSVLAEDGIPEQKISLAPSGVDVNRYAHMRGESVCREFSIPPEAPVLGNIAYLVEHKGQAYLIQAMAEVVKSFPTARLFILGTGSLESHLKNLTKSLNLERNIIFTGFRNDVGAFLKAMTVLVVSSIQEGLNSTILDALAAEIPVVATDAGGIPEIIEPEVTGVLVPSRDPGAMASAIIRLLKNPEHAKTLGRNGRKKVQDHFSETVMVEKNIQVYNKLLCQRRG